MKYSSPPTLFFTPSAWGVLLLASTARGLCGAWFEGQKHLPNFIGWPTRRTAFIDQATAQLAEYFAGQRKQFDIPLDLSAGTEFQQSVWCSLLSIDCGELSTYGAIAKSLGKPAAVRAVGAAVGRNPISIIVPCHRVVGSTGALTGYAGGLERKSALLRLEGTRPDNGTAQRVLI
jgi:methylated-DNA-[protein]-cysteine S-methyltransferase